MGIFKKGKNYYADYYVEGRRKRECGGPNRKVAETLLAKRKVQVAEGRFLDIRRNEKITFGEMGQLYLETYSKVNKRSFNRDVTLIANLAKVLQKRYLYEITALDVEDYKRRRLAEDVCVATVNRELSCLRGVLNKAVEWAKLQTPVPRMKFFREDNWRLRYLEKDEAVRLLAAADEPLKSVIGLALNTGMRLGEILTLKWQDVDVNRGFVTLRGTKSGKMRHVPVNRLVVEILMRNRGSGSLVYVFPGRDPSLPLSKSHVSRAFSVVAKKAGILDFRFHDLRHTFASWLVMGGVNLKTVQELLGHQDYVMTLRHAHLSPDVTKQAVELIGNELSSGSGAPENGHQMDTIWTPEAKSATPIPSLKHSK